MQAGAYIGDGKEATGIGSFQGLTAHSLPGGMALLNLPAAGLHHLPETIGPELGALIEALAVASHAVKATGRSPGDDCVILEAGPIGIALIMAARALGGSRIIVIERIPARPETVGLVASRKIDAEAMITRVESTPEIGPVFGELASAKEDVKVLLKPLH